MLSVRAANNRQFASAAPIFKRPVVQARVVAEILRDKVNKTRLLPDMAVADDLISLLDTGVGKNFL